MKYAQLLDIQGAVRAGRSCEHIAADYPDVLYDTIVSIWSAIQRIKSEEQRLLLKSPPGMMARRRQWAHSFRSGVSLLQLSASVGVSPCSLARDLLDELLSTPTLKLSKEQLRDAFRDPRAFFQRWDVEQQGAKMRTNEEVATTAARVGGAVSSARWVRELEECVQHDSHNSPFQDSIKNLTGAQYELLLESHLRSLCVPFFTESAQRAAGSSSHKTPDFLLGEPILIHGHLVHWVDSKAHFADGAVKEKHLREQLRGYVNRFGNGAVVYWLDFVEDEPNSCSAPITSLRPRSALRTSSGSSSQPVTDATSPSSSSSSSPDSADTATAGLLLPSFARVATYDNGSILLLTDFPAREHVRTLGEMLQRELAKEGWTPPATASAQTTTATSTAGDGAVDAADVAALVTAVSGLHVTAAAETIQPS